MTTLSITAHNPIVRALHRSGLLAEDIDYHVVRASMVIMFLFFGYQKWFPYESDETRLARVPNVFICGEIFPALIRPLSESRRREIETQHALVMALLLAVGHTLLVLSN